MHIMVNKRYMRKCDARLGHEAHINKLLLKKPPSIMSADSASLYEPLKSITEREREREREEKCKTEKYIKMHRGRRRTQSPVLGIESSETSCIPWVWLESVIRCVSQAVRSTSQDLVNYEGTFPLGLEFILFLVRQA